MGQEGEIMSEYQNDTRCFDKNKEEDEETMNSCELTAAKYLNRANSNFWTISRVFPDYYAPGIEYGFATVFLTINGIQIPGERLIEHSHKPGWLLIPKIYEKDLVSKNLEIDPKTSELAENSEQNNFVVEPEITVKNLYSKLPPMVRLQTIEKQKLANED